MRIIIDLQGAQASNRTRGIGRYAEALAYHLCQHRGDHDIHLVLNEAFADSIEEIRAKFLAVLPKTNIHVFNILSPSHSLEDENTQRRTVNEAMREAFIGSLQPDYVIVTSLFEGLVDDAITSINSFTNFPTAVVLYDLIPHIYPEPYLENPIVSKWYLRKLNYLKRADLLLAISQSSKQEAIDWLGFDSDDITNISTACDDQFKPLTLSTQDYNYLSKTYNITKPFVMYTGGIDHRKNIEGLIRAFANLPQAIRQEHQLAVVCSVQPSDRERLMHLAQRVGLSKNDYIMTGYVPEDDLVKLYNACKLFVFPSLHEGFGLPALEAMQCGTAVIASNTSSLPEVVGLDIALFDPRLDDTITEKMAQVLTDENLRQALQQHGLTQAKNFNWDTIALDTLQALETSHHKLIADIPSPSAFALHHLNPRKRLAYLSPIPPERSGISDYSIELLTELTRWYDIDIIINPTSIGTDDIIDSWIIANLTIRTTDWFIQNSHFYDRVLYHFGNSEFHKHMFSLLDKIPGIVMLHDFYLSGIQSYRDAMGWASHAWKQNLYHSHGYTAVYLAENEAYPHEALWTYPANLKVIQDALGIIVHSENSKKLVEQWYGQGSSHNWQIVPFVRTPPTLNNKVEARQALNIPLDAFVVCSFGIIGKTKCTLELVEAFLASKLAKDTKCHLIIVGQQDTGGYGKRIEKLIAMSGIAKRITITGWTATTEFRQYLQVADVAVQLRTLSRGETSGAVLDCMNYGIATIVNANGSMAYLNKDSIMMISDNFDLIELVTALDSLYLDTALRQTVSNNALNTLRKEHQPRQCAIHYFEAIEAFYHQQSHQLYGLIKHIQHHRIPYTPDENALQVLAQNFPAQPRQKMIFVDISELVMRDSRTGIQRVVRSILQALLNKPPLGYRIEPVYANTATLGYFYARKFTCEFLGIQDTAWCSDTAIEYQAGDIFFGLDLQPAVIPFQHPYLLKLKHQGVQVSFMVYDLLGITHAQYFVPNAATIIGDWITAVAQYDQVICISKAVADEVKHWTASHGQPRYTPLLIDWCHLGADLNSSVPTKGMPNNASQTLKRLRASPSFLMVGTLEPRKAHAQVLDDFELLWQQGLNVNFVIVGKLGWQTEDLARRIQEHPALGYQLFWLDSISDEYLEQIYAVCTCLIAASYGEGFGLPLIEAAQHHLPIIARDIAVFREVAGEFATYFTDSKQAGVIADCVQAWLVDYANDEHIKSDAMPYLTWEQSTQQLISLLLQGE